MKVTSPRTAVVAALQRYAPGVLVLLRARHLLSHSASYLRQTGYLRSLHHNLPVDSEGRPLPFINYPMAELLRERLPRTAHVFEYGSGYSTVFFLSLAASVTAVEHDPAWHARTAELTAGQAGLTLLHREGENYPAAIEESSALYDLVFVDGRQRIKCAEAALRRLSPAGVLLWDDSDRPRYQPGLDFLKGRGFRIIRIGGLKPAGLERAESAICYRDANCLGL